MGKKYNGGENLGVREYKVHVDCTSEMDEIVPQPSSPKRFVGIAESRIANGCRQTRWSISVS
jgi:hypothetical protein